ncbi:MAG: hypothetical protein Q8911_08875 [Bacillota bacterium]|nr:hypothetical protein [Bacillota bacterium]
MFTKQRHFLWLGSTGVGTTENVVCVFDAKALLNKSDLNFLAGIAEYDYGQMIE